MPDPHLHVDLSENLAPVGAFLIEHWPNPATAPTLVTTNGQLQLRVNNDDAGMNDLATALAKALEADGQMGFSASAFKEALFGALKKGRPGNSRAAHL